MSPIKRILSDLEVASIKRLRGGGIDDEDMIPEPEDLYDDAEDDIKKEEEQYIPDEALDEDAARLLHSSDKQRWARPDLPEMSNTKDLDVQWIDMDVVSGAALSQNPNRKKKLMGQSEGQVPILRTYGVTESGHSVTIFIHGFTPYAYFSLPVGSKCDQSKLGELRNVLTDRMQASVRSTQAASSTVLGIEYISDHKSIMGYETPHNEFLKIYVSLPGLVPALKRIMEESTSLPGITFDQTTMASLTNTFGGFEANVPFVLRFLVDQDITGAGWLTLPAETYQIRPVGKKETLCQVRVVDVLVRDRSTAAD